MDRDIERYMLSKAGPMAGGALWANWMHTALGAVFSQLQAFRRVELAARGHARRQHACMHREFSHWGEHIKFPMACDFVHAGSFWFLVPLRCMRGQTSKPRRATQYLTSGARSPCTIIILGKVRHLHVGCAVPRATPYSACCRIP